MSLTTAALREMVSIGLTAEQILAIAEANEGGNERTARQERNRRYYERKRLKASEQDASNASEEDPLPLPSSPQTPQLPTPTPENNTRTRKGRPAKPVSVPDADLDRIWSAANPISRGRSGRPDTGEAIAAALAKGATLEAIEASVRHHCRVSGDHPKGLHRIIRAELWRDHASKREPPGLPLSPEYRAHCEHHYRMTGEWKPEWGEKPRQAA